MDDRVKMETINTTAGNQRKNAYLLDIRRILPPTPLAALRGQLRA
jgi:hypothetical protein